MKSDLILVVQYCRGAEEGTLLCSVSLQHGQFSAYELLPPSAPQWYRATIQCQLDQQSLND